MIYLDVACRCALIVVFAVSAFTKSYGSESFARFVRSVRDMGVLPERVAARPVALAVVSAEVAIPLLLVVPSAATGSAGFVLAAGLLLGFTVAIVLSVRRGNQTPCRCFGHSTVPLGVRHVWRNGALILVAASGAVAAMTGAGTTEPGVTAVAVVAGLVVGGLVTVFDDLAELVSPSAPRRKETLR
ncbi:MauE/DoxX family redox-associated membrane protein [Stackebrandtia albiflava]|uniref:MauE/DoxX family redox-associated membrane protein n=1 Tax=Stackebrandtia albiflava TaxID=406432 RepID=UPI001315471E|nr:MauE/DoxX family redox-associated membrane protein [Stackebrandtia albiflava]